MKEDIAGIIQDKLGIDVVDILTNKLSGSELNSLLMKVFANRVSKMTPADLLRSYMKNRFAQPAESDYIKLLQQSVEALQFFRERGFEPRQLSPLVPLGTCSVVGVVDQNKIVPAARNGEILSDATNALALEIAVQKKQDKARASSREQIKYACVQRHMRAQVTHIKGFTPHFTIGCLVTAGRDEGSFGFELSAMTDHLVTMTTLLKDVFAVDSMFIKLQPRLRYSEDFISKLHDHVKAHLPELDIYLDGHAPQNNYYHGVQFKVVIHKHGRELEIADGGLVDWTQKLLNDKKERYCISGFGLELLNKLEEGLL